MTFDDQIAVRTLWAEARGEPNEGQRAVAHVLINRQKDGRWGKTLAEVCLAHKQFSCWLQSDPNWKALLRLSDFDPVLVSVGAALSAARQEPDFTGGATHYYALSMPNAPIWTLGATLCGQWGHQKFYKGVE